MGHRRQFGGQIAGLDEMPCIIREMTDLETVREMRNSSKQRGNSLPSELAKLLDLELETIKRQGARSKNDKEAETLGKLSVEIVGKAHDMNYKKVLRYVRLNNLVPELLEKVDAKNMGFMPAVELSYIKPENQRLIAVSIDGEQSSPSVKQTKRLRELSEKKKALYAEYRKAQANMREAVAVKGSIDFLRGYPDGREDKVQER